MRSDLKERQCDYCSKTVSGKGDTIGGSVFDGWWALSRHNGSSRILRPNCGPWDFCSLECMQEFLAKGGHDMPPMKTPLKVYLDLMNREDGARCWNTDRFQYNPRGA